MKQKILAVLITAAMLGTSVAPVTAAEFSSGEETAAVQENDVVGLEEEFSSGAGAGYNYDDDEDYDDEDDDDYDDDYDGDYDDDEDMESAVQSIKIVKGPDVDTYYYGLEIQEADFLDCDGLTAEITYKDGSTSTLTFGYIDEEVFDEWDNEFVCLLEENDDSFGIGTYHFYVKQEYGDEIRSDSCPVYVVSPENLPELNQNTSGSAITTVQTRSNSVLAKFVPQKSGVCALTFINAYGETIEPDLYDKNFNMINHSGLSYAVNRGETYYIIGYVGGESTQVTVEYYAGIESIKVVKEPTVKYAYEGFIRFDGFYLRNGEIEITYSDGTSEIVSTNRLECKTKYGQMFTPKYIESSDGLGDMTYSLSSELGVIFKGVELRPREDMPTINGTGSKTVDTLGSGSTWLHLKTGKNKAYKIESSGNYGLAIFKDYGTEFYQEAPGCADLPSKATVVLEPDSDYYITVGPGVSAKDDRVTYTVSTSKYDISKCNIDLKSSYTCTGKALKPAVKINYGYTDRNIKLKAGRDYTVTYTNNKNVGTAKVKITGKGEFAGSVTKTFKITLGKPALKTVSKSGSAAIKVSWNKVNGATGYEVYRYTGSKWTKIATTKATSYTDKKVKKGTTYKYKIRAYTKANKKTVYSAYSAEKSVKR